MSGSMQFRPRVPALSCFAPGLAPSFARHAKHLTPHTDRLRVVHGKVVVLPGVQQRVSQPENTATPSMGGPAMFVPAPFGALHPVAPAPGVVQPSGSPVCVVCVVWVVWVVWVVVCGVCCVDGVCGVCGVFVCVCVCVWRVWRVWCGWCGWCVWCGWCGWCVVCVACVACLVCGVWVVWVMWVVCV